MFTATPAWEVELDNGWWQRLDDKTERLIHEAQEAGRSFVEYSVLVHDYVIDIQQLEQVNRGTGKRRAIRCAQATSLDAWGAPAPTNSQRGGSNRGLLDLFFGCRCLRPAVDRDDAEGTSAQRPLKPDAQAAVAMESTGPGQVQTPSSSALALLAHATLASGRLQRAPDPHSEEEVIVVHSDEALSSRVRSVGHGSGGGGSPRGGGRFSSPLQAAVERFSRPASMSSRPPAVSAQVMLNIYDLGNNSYIKALNRCLDPFAAGAFHCGVEVYGLEWSFSDTDTGEGMGVFCSKPRCCEDHCFREAVALGTTRLRESEVWQIIQQMMRSWLPLHYNVLTRNCCHFCHDLCHKLQVGPVPSRILRLAGVGACLKAACCAAGNVPEDSISLKHLPSHAKPPENLSEKARKEVRNF